MSVGEYISGREQSAGLNLDCDTVVVGSGASGAVVAAKLAAAGERVVIVEEGPRVAPSEYQKMRPTEHLRALWREGGATVAIGLGDSPIINVTMGRAVGGSSLLTGGVCFRTPNWVLAEWQNDHGLEDFTPERMERFFEEVEERASIHEVPESIRSKSTTLWADGAARRGIELKPTHRNTAGCKGFAQCNFGCPIGAKMSVDVSYLPTAIDHGTIIVSDFLVEKATLDGSRATGITGWLLDARRKKRHRASVKASRVVFAAGAAHTPLLLWKTGSRLKQIGRNLTLHPGFRMLARFDEPVRGWEGALQSAYTDHFEDEGFTLISVFVPPFAVASGVPGFGSEFTDRVEHLDKLAMFGGLIHDEGGGRIRKNPFGREPLMTYRMSAKDRDLVPRVVRELGETYLAAGARELYIPVLGHDPVDADAFRSLDLESIPMSRFECTSQHPLGTTRMGTSKDHSVVDKNGAVWDTKGLYVVDGGTLPTSLGVNPQQSIMALATRFAERMIDR